MVWDPDVIRFTDVQVTSDRTPITRQFFNERYKLFSDAIGKVATKLGELDIIEQNFVSLALARLDTTLGPLLTTLESAAELGFLVAQAVNSGSAKSLTVGQAFDLNVTDGADLFTPTQFLLAVDNTDPDNWGIVQLVQWTKSTAELSTNCIYASKTQTSDAWTVSVNSAFVPAMATTLADVQAAQAAAEAALADIQQAVSDIQTALDAIQDGPVVSVAGRSGVVTLGITDVTNLQTTLNDKISTSQLATKQNLSAKLSALADMTWATNQLLMATGAATVIGQSISAYMVSLFSSTDATALRSALSLGTAALQSATYFATDADMTTAEGNITTLTSGKADKSGGAAQITGTINPATLLITPVDVPGGYTLQSGDCGKKLRCTSATNVTWTLPASLPAGWNCLWEQRAAGRVTFTPASGATRRHRLNHVRSAGQYAVGSLLVDNNSGGAAADYTLTGDTST